MSLLLVGCGGGDDSAEPSSGGSTTSSSDTGSSSGTTTSTTSSTSSGSTTDPDDPPPDVDAGTPADPPPNLGNCQLFPADNWWNTDVSADPVDVDSDTYLGALGTWKMLAANFSDSTGLPFAVVDGSTPKVPVSFIYPEISDAVPFPIPANPPVEANQDRHVLLVHTDECKLYELFQYNLLPTGVGASAGVVWDLTKNEQRPQGQGSADAAGLQILPGLVKYDEADAGEIKHAIRFFAPKTQQAWVFPATSFGSQARPRADFPPMGTRIRLKASVDISGFAPRMQAVLKALKKYGAILADNGPQTNFLFFDGATDPRWDGNEMNSLHSLHVSDLEVVQLGPITKGW